MPDSADEVKSKRTADLCAFIVRARRVEEHTLAQDKSFVQQVAEGTYTVTMIDGEDEATISVLLPASEELLESATARVRPLVLKTEATHSLTALNALRYLLRDYEEHFFGSPYQQAYYEIRAGWMELEADYRSPLSRFTLMLSTAGESQSIPFEDLAWAWVYGDVVHAFPERRDQTAAYGVRARYEAGAMLTCQIILQAIATLNLIRQIRAQGWIDLPDDPFTEQVTIGTDPFIQRGKIYSAPHTSDEALPELPANAEQPLDVTFRQVTTDQLRAMLDEATDSTQRTEPAEPQADTSSSEGPGR